MESVSAAPTKLDTVRNKRDIPVYFDPVLFNTGRELKLEPDAVVVFVGPNNGGKSTALRDLAGRIYATEHRSGHNVIKDAFLKSTMSPVEVAELLFSRAKKGPDGRRRFATGLEEHQFNEDLLAQIKARKTNVPDPMLGAFARLLVGEERLQTSKTIQSHAAARTPASHPLQWAYENENLEREISGHVKKAFGKGIVVNRCGGSEINLHYGDAPPLAGGEQYFHNSYQQKLAALPQVWQQGDGVRAFTSVLLSAYCGQHSIIMVDEPEAFLHPPQARELGLVLSSARMGEGQTFIATHSSDVLRGLLDNPERPLTIVRLERDGESNKAEVLSSTDVKNLSSDTLLRHSQLLDGLFHDRVILCESDADCRFYSVLWEGVRRAEKSDTRLPDVLFAPMFGKGRAAEASDLLNHVMVRSSVILDFDALNNVEFLSKLVAVRRGDWKTIEPLARTVETSGRTLKGMAIKWTDQRAELIKTVEAEPDYPSGAKLAKIRELMMASKSWELAKKKGISILPAGEIQTKAKELLALLMTVGIHVIHVGELESWDQTLEPNKETWLGEVLKKNPETAPEFKEARDFVRSVAMAGR